jgi:hypothetical protein
VIGIYSIRLANKDGEISLLTRQRDDYKDKLGGASPDQAKAKIDTLEKRIEGAESISDPIVDVIILALLRTKGAARIETIIQAVIDARFDKADPGRREPALIMFWQRAVERALATLQALHYVDAKDNEYELTDAGRLVFQRVGEHESQVLARFKHDI